MLNAMKGLSSSESV